MRQTLEAMGGVSVPEGMQAELVAVDNGSTDDTAQVLQEAAPPGWAVQYVLERRVGKCYALNAGVRVAKGDILLFTDDDVRPGREWITGMSEPILSGRADLVGGGVKIAQELDRPWLTKRHRARLAEIEPWPVFRYCVGANMAVHRRVFEYVRGFDPELGPGRLGAHEEGLLQMQIHAAGLRLVGAEERATVVHHFGASRLRRGAFKRLARMDGASSAYVAYHWHHESVRSPRLRSLRTRLQLWRLMLRKWRFRAEPEGMDEQEYRHREMLSYLLQIAREQRRPRNYEQHGLVKIRGEMDRLPDLSSTSTRNSQAGITSEADARS